MELSRYRMHTSSRKAGQNSRRLISGYGGVRSTSRDLGSRACCNSERKFESCYPDKVSNIKIYDSKFLLAPMDKLVKSSPFHGGDSEFEPQWEYKNNSQSG